MADRFQIPPLLILSVLVIVSSALLWLGGTIAAAGRGRGKGLSRGLRLAATVLTGVALWWPGQARLATGEPTPAQVIAGLVFVGLSVAVAALMISAATHWRSRRKLAAGMFGGMGALCGWLHAAMAAPSERGMSWADYGLAGLYGIAVAGGLLAMHLDLPKARRARVARAGVAALIVLPLMLAAGDPSQHVGESFDGGEVVLLAAFFGLAAALFSVMIQVGQVEAVTTKRTERNVKSIDPLTHLPNRVYFEEKLEKAARRCERDKSQLALFFIDLDGFKPVNDTFGHSAGDRVLEAVGERLRGLSRGRDIVARQGGDEFLMMLPGVSSQEKAAQIATRVIDGLSRPCSVEERDIRISCSIGIAFFPNDCSPDKLIARADAAMYAAKRAGGSSYAFYTPEMEVDVQDKFDLLHDLRGALEANQLELFFQPKIDARTGKVTAAEALLRWRHPTRGQVPPGTFIPVAERFGLIGAIGNWVIEDACRQARVWRDHGLRMRVAINLSVHQMRQPDIVERIAEALDRHRIHPSLLTCEITESAAMEDTRATQETFRRLGALGAHLAIDDFGTGYSSLSYLRQLPAEELKIDRSFVMDLEHSVDARAVVDAVVKLAHALGLKVVAEGVETPQQRQILVDLGCNELQGYLFAKPMSARALLLWALRDRDETAVFTPSLFGETREAEPWQRPAGIHRLRRETAPGDLTALPREG